MKELERSSAFRGYYVYGEQSPKGEQDFFITDKTLRIIFDSMFRYKRSLRSWAIYAMRAKAKSFIFNKRVFLYKLWLRKFPRKTLILSDPTALIVAASEIMAGKQRGWPTNG